MSSCPPPTNANVGGSVVNYNISGGANNLGVGTLNVHNLFNPNAAFHYGVF